MLSLPRLGWQYPIEVTANAGRGAYSSSRTHVRFFFLIP